MKAVDFIYAITNALNRNILHFKPKDYINYVIINILKKIKKVVIIYR